MCGCGVNKHTHTCTLYGLPGVFTHAHIQRKAKSSEKAEQKFLLRTALDLAHV